MQIIGRLTEDAVLKSTVRQGVKSEFVTFTVAVNEKRGDETSTTYYECTMAKTGVFDLLKQGTKVFAFGRYRFLMTTDEKTGKQYAHHNIGVMELQLLESKKKEEAAAEA